MPKLTWTLDPIEDCVIVSRVIDTGDTDDDDQPILKVSRHSREDMFLGIQEIRASLDMLEKELRAQEKKGKEPKKTL